MAKPNFQRRQHAALERCIAGMSLDHRTRAHVVSKLLVMLATDNPSFDPWLFQTRCEPVQPVLLAGHSRVLQEATQ